MPTDQPRCEPPAGLRERDGPHWVQHGNAKPIVAYWHAGRQKTYPTFHHPGEWEIGVNHIPAKDAWHWGYRYLMPCPTPEEIAALVSAGRAVDRWMLVISSATRYDPSAAIDSDKIMTALMALAAELARFPQTGERG